MLRFSYLLALTMVSTPLASVAHADDWVPGDPEFPDPTELGEQSYWVPLSEFGENNPGAEPLVRAVPGQSTADRTTLDIELHGFWVRAFRDRDQKFDRQFHALELGSRRATMTTEVGRAALPRINAMLGIAPDGWVDLFAPEVLETRTFTNVRVAPLQPDETEYPNGENFPVPFEMDEKFYQSQMLWPSERATAAGGFNPEAPNLWRGMRVCSFNVAPFQVVPSSRVLNVATRLRVSVSHVGTLDHPLTVSRQSRRIFENAVLNFHVLVDLGLIGAEPDEYIGDYLFVGPEDDLLAAIDLMRLKSERGYRIHTRTTESMSNPLDPNLVYAEIKGWYQARDAASEKFVLLVGNEEVIAPMNTSLTWTITRTNEDGGDTYEEEILGISDQRYTSMDGDPYPEFGIGRLSNLQSDDLEDYVARAVEYATNPPSDSQYYSHATLVAHHGSDEENAYRECADSIMDATYDNPRSFNYVDGLQNWADNSMINLALETDLAGIIWYRGHGSQNSWAGWNLQNDPDDRDDWSHHYSWTSMSSVLNDYDSTMDGSPIVLSVACSNGRIDRNDPEDWSMAEHWMNAGWYHGAINHIGATRVSGRSMNNEYSKRMWKYLLDDDFYALSIANEYAWVDVVSCHPSGTDFYESALWNQQVYMLLGDPETRIWHEEPISFSLELAGQVIPGASFDARVSANNLQIEGAIVVLSEVDAGPIASGFTNSIGEVTLHVPQGLTKGNPEFVVRAWSDRIDSVDARIAVVDIPADFDGDGQVNGTDLAMLLGAWGTMNADFDLDGNEMIDGADLAMLLGAWMSG